MTRLLRLISAVFGLCAMTHAALANPNLIINGSFESGVSNYPQTIAGWTSRSGGNSLECVNPTVANWYGVTTVPDGLNFCEVEFNVLSPPTLADWMQQTVTTTVGKTYILSVQATTRLSTSTQDRGILTAAGTNIANFTTTSSWANYSGSFIASSTSTAIQIVSDGSATGSTQPGDGAGLLIDDVQVQQLTVSPSSGTLAEDTSLTFKSATSSTQSGDSTGLLMDNAQVQQLTVSPSSGTSTNDTAVAAQSDSTQSGDSTGLLMDDAQVQVQQPIVSPSPDILTDDTALTVKPAINNAFQVAGNSTAATLTAKFTVSNGKLTLASTTGLTFTTGSNGTASFTISGTAAAINAALNAGITYVPTPDYNGSDSLAFTVTAGTATSTDIVPLTITPVADITADSVTTTQNTAISFNAITGTNGATSDSFSNTPTAVTVSTPAHGTAVASTGNLGLITYTPAMGYFGTDTFTYTVTSGGVTETATEAITITPLPPSLTLSKTSTGNTGSFTFTGSNGWVSQTISTTAAGIAASGAAQTLTAVSTATTITEAANAGFVLSTATCTDSNSANTGKTGNFGTLSGTTLTIPAANVIAGAAIACTFTNAKAVPGLSIAKSVSPSGPIGKGQVLTYTYTINNTGNVPMTNVTISDVHNGTGAFTGPFGETLTVGTSGTSSDATSNDGIWSILGVGDTVTLKATYTVSQHDIDYLQ